MAKKPTTKKAVKKVAAKKVVAKKAPAKKDSASKAKIPTKKALKTSIIARVDVGFGNQLYVRGTGADLSWEKGLQLENVSSYEWAFATTKAKSDVVFKFLINDELWAEGDNIIVAKGATSISSPVFTW
jgi:hypothetical protein